MPIFLGLTLTNGAVNKPAQPSSLELPSWTLFFRSRWHFLMVQHDLRPWGLSLILRTKKKPVAPDEPAPIAIPVHSYGQLWARCPKLRPVRISCLSPYGKWAWLQIPRCGIHANRNRNKWDLWEGAMKCGNIALFFVIASLFLLLVPPSCCDGGSWNDSRINGPKFSWWRLRWPTRLDKVYPSRYRGGIEIRSKRCIFHGNCNLSR